MMRKYIHISSSTLYPLASLPPAWKNKKGIKAKLRAKAL
jgi:hypothetical protein